LARGLERVTLDGGSGAIIVDDKPRLFCWGCDDGGAITALVELLALIISFFEQNNNNSSSSNSDFDCQTEDMGLVFYLVSIFWTVIPNWEISTGKSIRWENFKMDFPVR
jgi:hypothetical protein